MVNEHTFEELRELFEKLKRANQTDIKATADEDNRQCGDNLASDPTQVHFDVVLMRLDEILPNLNTDTEVFYKILTMKASLIYEQAKIRLALEDNEGSQELLEKCLEIVLPHKDHYRVTFLYFRIVNHFAYLLSKNGYLTKSMELLENVTRAEIKQNILVYSTEELFMNKEFDQSQASSKLNKLIVNNYQMLGWIYGKLGFVDKHALKQHEALQKQLEINDVDLILWACRCTRVSTLFLSIDQWANAKYHLAAAGAVLDRFESNGTATPAHPELGKAQADLARGWIHYGLQLFSVSKKLILDQMYSADSNGAVGDGGGGVVSTEETTKSEKEETVDKNLIFINLDVPPVNVPSTQIKTTEQARALFLHTHTWLKCVRIYYTLRDYPLQYVNAVLDLSELYRFLAFYEPDLDSQYNVQKRRADALETLSTILREVRPQCYVAVSVELLRELAEVQIELMGINLRKLYIAEGSNENEDSIKRRMQAVSDIHAKLETVGDMLGHSTLEDLDQDQIEPEVETADECACGIDEECMPNTK